MKLALDYNDKYLILLGVGLVQLVLINSLKDPKLSHYFEQNNEFLKGLNISFSEICDHDHILRLENSVLMFGIDEYLKSESVLKNLELNNEMILLRYHNQEIPGELKVSGTLDLDLNLDHHIMLLNRLALSASRKDNSQWMAMAQSKLDQAKKLHEKVVPLRTIENRNFIIHSKYGAGESAGGDYFDFYKAGSKIIYLHCSSLSHITTTIIMRHFEQFKGREWEKEAVEYFFETMLEELREFEAIDRTQPETCELSLLCLSESDLTVEGYSFGRYQIIGSEVEHNENNYSFNENNFEKAKFLISANRGDSIKFFSPGVFKNENEFDEKISVDYSLDGADFLNEYFYQMKSKSKMKKFLKYDATVMIIKAKKNALLEV